MPFTVTLKGQLGLNIKAGPNGKSIEVTSVKPNLAADEWNTLAFVEGDDASVIAAGDVIKQIDNVEVLGMSFDNTKTILAKISKEDKNFKIVFLRPNELPGASSSSPAAAADSSSPTAAASADSNEYEIKVKGALAIGIKAGPGGKSIEVTEIKAGGAAEGWNKSCSADTKIQIGHVISGIGSDDVSGKSYDDVKGILGAKSKSGNEFTVRFSRQEKSSSKSPPASPSASAAASPASPSSSSSSSSSLPAGVSYQITAKGGLSIGIKAGPGGKSIEVTEIKAGGAAEAWNKEKSTSAADKVTVGDVIAAIGSTVVTSKSYDDVKSLLITQSKSGKEFTVGFSRPGASEEKADAEPASTPAAAAVASPEPATPSNPDEFVVTVKGGLSVGIKAGPGGKSLEVTEVKAGGAAESWNKTAAANNRIAVGQLVVSLNGTDIRNKSFDDVKALLVTNSKSGKEFSVGFLRKTEKAEDDSPAAAEHASSAASSSADSSSSSSSSAASSSPPEPLPADCYRVTVTGSLLVGVKAGPGGKSIEVTDVKPNGAAALWNKDAAEDSLIKAGDLVHTLDGIPVDTKSYEDTKTILGKLSRSGNSFVVLFQYSADRAAAIRAKKEEAAKSAAPVDDGIVEEEQKSSEQPSGAPAALTDAEVLVVVDALLQQVMPFAPNAQPAPTPLTQFAAGPLQPYFDKIDLSLEKYSAL